MQNSEDLLKNDSIKLTTQQSLRRLSFCSQISTVQQSSPVVFPEKRNKGKTFSVSINNDDTNKEKSENHRIDIGDEQSDLLGDEVFSGKLSLSKNSENTSQNFVDAKLTIKALIWGPKILHLKDVVSLSYCFGLRHFTIHSYQFKKASCGFSCFIKAVKVRKDYRFLASNTEEAIQWVSSFADQQFYVNFLSHPLNSKKNQSSEFVNSETPHEVYIRCKNPPRVLVILNPRSGSGRSSKVFHDKVEPIFKLAGFEIEVVKTTSAGHARKLASTVDFSTCPDGIICVGGDGIVNEVLNGLLSRDNQKEGISVPIGIIPAGSDNSLVYTVLGVTDPISAAISIVKGGLTAIDVFAVEWIHTGAIHFGMIVTYFGFVSDVLELSERYQKRFGPLRYLVAGFFKFLCLPKYTFEVEYLPSIKESINEGKITDQEEINMSELYTDIMRRSQREGLPRASSLSSIDSIITPSRISDIDNNTEPSEYVRAIDSKSKRLSLTRNNNSNSETEVVHSQQTRNYVRTRSKSRTDKIWTGLTVSSLHDKEDISSTMSDPGGHVWETEPRWDSDETDGLKTEKVMTEIEEKWVKTKGRFLGVLVCNHACKTVQNRAQVLAPKAEHDDNNMDLLLVHGSGRIKLLRFLIHLQKGSHVSLPYVEYVKVKSVKVKLGKHSHNGCGIDGELFPVNGQVVSSLLPEQCRLIGRLSNNI